MRSYRGRARSRRGSRASSTPLHRIGRLVRSTIATTVSGGIESATFAGQRGQTRRHARTPRGAINYRVKSRARARARRPINCNGRAIGAGRIIDIVAALFTVPTEFINRFLVCTPPYATRYSACPSPFAADQGRS